MIDCLFTWILLEKMAFVNGLLTLQNDLLYKILWGMSLPPE